MFSLTAYTVEIKELKTKKNVVLDKFDGQHSLLREFHSFINLVLDRDYIHKAEKRVMRFKSVDKIVNDYFVSRVETGEYGFTSDLYDTESKTNTYLRKGAEAEMLPFFLFAKFPKGEKKGVLIFQRFKQFGIRTSVMEYLTKDFNSKHAGYQLTLAKAVPSAVLKEILTKGQVKVFRFVKYQASTDICDAVAKIDVDGVTSEVEYVVKAKRNGFFGLLDPLKKEINNPHPNFKSIVEIPNFDYDTIKVDVDIAGTRRSVDLGKLFKISANVDITDEVELGSNGHPTKDSVVTICSELAVSILT
jgi:hypothetical protein